MSKAKIYENAEGEVYVLALNNEQFKNTLQDRLNLGEISQEEYDELLLSTKKLLPGSEDGTGYLKFNSQDEIDSWLEWAYQNLENGPNFYGLNEQEKTSLRKKQNLYRPKRAAENKVWSKEGSEIQSAIWDAEDALAAGEENAENDLIMVQEQRVEFSAAAAARNKIRRTNPLEMNPPLIPPPQFADPGETILLRPGEWKKGGTRRKSKQRKSKRRKSKRRKSKRRKSKRRKSKH